MIVEFDGDWAPYIMCSVCRAPSGIPCYTRSGRVVDGQPDAVPHTLQRPHIARKRSVSKRFRQ